MKRTSLTSIVLLLAIVPAVAGDPSSWRLQGWKTDFSRTAVSLDEILSGGPPRDGIPPIDRPHFKAAREITDIAAREPVIVFPVDGNSRAYPLRVLMWHEIVNDTVDGLPVSVTYCPLCNASIVFDRRVNGRVLDFGTTGLLRNSDLVMWDRQTESWWQQFSGDAIVGGYTGSSLKMLPSRVIAFGEFLRRRPDGLVLIPENPGLRRYGNNPYVDYEKASSPFLFRGELPKGLPAMAHVVVVRDGKRRAAVSLALLSERKKIVHDGTTFRWNDGVASSLGHSVIANSQDIGAVEVTDGSGKPLVHDVTFAFVLHAFVPDAKVLTKQGLVVLATGATVSR